VITPSPLRRRCLDLPTRAGPRHPYVPAMETSTLPLVAGMVSTAVFAGSMLPMLVKAARTRDLSSYSIGNLVLANIGNAVHSVYVFHLPAGPIWFLHGFYLLTSALMLCWWVRYRPGARKRGGEGTPTGQRLWDQRWRCGARSAHFHDPRPRHGSAPGGFLPRTPAGRAGAPGLAPLGTGPDRPPPARTASEFWSRASTLTVPTSVWSSAGAAYVLLGKARGPGRAQPPVPVIRSRVAR
jgi:uncharacterized protein with PQ loop repeat